MKKNLVKLYDQLTGLERLRLAIEAKARGDEAEFAHLVQSCPRANYRSAARAYVVLMEATIDLVGAVCHDFDRGIGRLQALDAVQSMIYGLIGALSKLGAISKSDNARREIETIIETFEGLSEMQLAFFRGAMLAEIKAVYEALGKFFQGKLDLTAATVLKAIASPYWEWLEALKEEISGVEVDPEIVADMQKRLDKYWNIGIE